MSVGTAAKQKASAVLAVYGGGGGRGGGRVETVHGFTIGN